ncbi:endospore germination permease [Neobacillus cucumis]|uniref:endospore germination permease n=1 Tax=Neobacillus cucumis TaxID=1740721 RepID=UPI002E1E8739|nr:endospore germination permease [Neobacillus cucumis]MED4229415.1 endospore germination permease [Neobacillus cucumis]
MQKVIYSVHMYILLILSTGFMVHVLLHPVVLTSAKRDAWVSVIGSFVPFIIWTILIYFLYKKYEQKNIFTLIFSLPPWISYSISIIFGIYFFLTSFISFKYTIYWANANYTFNIPNFMIALLFAILCYYATHKGIGVISAIAFFLLPFVVIFGFLVGIGNMKNKDYSLLFPIFEHGYRHVLHGMVYTCASLFETIYFLFITPYLKNRIKMKMFLIVTIIIFLLTLGPLIGGIAEFGAEEAVKMKVLAYEQWKLLTLGTHITRLDFLSIYQWFSGAFIRVCLSMFLVNQLFFRKKNRWFLPFLYALLTFSVVIPWDFESFYSFLYSIYFPASLVFLLFSFGLLLLLSRIKGDVHE